jgi:MFS transporter, PPP family, 3-phenylpropionic acid transporter
MPSLRSFSPAFQLSFLCGSIYFYVGVFAPFFPIWLASRGLGAAEIALVIAVPMIARVIGNPLLLGWANKHHAVDKMIIISALLTLAGYVSLAFAQGFWPIFLLTGLTFFFQGALMPLSDVLILQHVKDDPNLHYGVIRSWGSILVLVGMLMSGALAGSMPSEAIIWLLVLAALIQLLTAMDLLAGSTKRASDAVAKPPRERIERFDLVLMVVVAAALVQSSHAMINAFGSIYWRSLGYSDFFIGCAWAIGVATEIVMFLVAGRYLGGIQNAMTFFILGAVSAMLRWGITCFDLGAIGILTTQAMHGLSFCATHLGTLFLLSRFVPASSMAQVQGLNGGSNSLFMALVTTLCGPLYVALGGQGVLFMILPAFLGLCLILIVWHLRRRAGLAGRL